MITYCAWCPKDAPPMHDDGQGTLISHGICQPHLYAMREKLKAVPHVDDVSPHHDRAAEDRREYDDQRAEIRAARGEDDDDD